MGERMERMLERLAAAAGPAEVFGPVRSIEELRRAYRRATLDCHPDRCPADPEGARQAFIRLTRWYELASAQLRAGRYGRPTDGVRLRHGDRVYDVRPTTFFRGDVANVYRGRHDGSLVAVKVARQARDNHLLLAERAALQRIARQVEARYHPFFPRLLDGFAYAGGEDGAPGASTETRAANVLSWVSGAFTMDEIRQALPAGVDPRDVAWIWRRLLAALGAAHRAGLVHGAVLPAHVCVLPQEHGLVLIGWTCTVEAGHPLPAISPAYEAWYPKEVMTKGPVGPATDVAMAARCMAFLLGEGGTGDDGPAAQRALGQFFRGCMLPAPRQRPVDAWALLSEFDELLARLWGPRRFHPFAVPAACPR